MNQVLHVKMQVLDDRLREHYPSYATPGSAGLDLRACISVPCVIKPGDVQLLSTGMAIHIANPGYAAIVIPRSGLGSRGLVLGNLVGLIDSDYQGPVTLSCWNRGVESFTIEPMDRVAQMIIVPVMQAVFEQVSSFDEDTDRGVGGFGSTGR